MMTRLRPWLELSRLSNLPTVWSNTLVGAAMAWHLTDETAPVHCAFCIALAALAMSCFYIAGMALNDVLDVSIDQQQRPTRPIPSGRITSKAATLYTCTLFTLGLIIIALMHRPALIPALILAALIVLYNLVHHRWSYSVIIMGGCRAMVYLTAAVTLAGGVVGDAAQSAWAAMMHVITHSSVLFPAALLWLYVIMISLLARSEADKPGRVKLVMFMLAGISLLDALLLMALWQHWPFAALAVSCFALTRIGHRFIKGS